ncbi:SPOR domain-containing protein [Trichloromonas sp.]|uniref:SPOR domain-containing protein n=1 Tax=Trichloromonas sp. TaxID=3069249 RepID=UPI003D818671
MMADDDKDFTFGDLGENGTDDDGWGTLEEDPGGKGEPGEDFAFDDSEPEPTPVLPPISAEPQAGEIPPVAAEEPADAHGRRSSSRMVLYGLLVMVLSAAGFYYFTTSPAPPAAKRPAPAKQTLAMPERPDPAAVPVPAGVEPVAVDREPVVDAAIPKGTLREVLPTESAPAPPIAAAAPVVPGTAAAPPVAAVVEKAASPAPEKKAPVAAKPPAAAGKYAIQAGAFVDQANRDEAMAKIRQLGFEGKLEPVKKVMPMTRLLIGVYAPETARLKAAELAKIVPSVFTLRRGDQLAVYAGSFYDHDKARELTDELARKGVRVDEEQTRVELNLTRLKFGSFPDQASAEAVVKRTRAAGLPAEVVRNP